MPTIPINLDQRTVDRLDLLVLKKIYKNRTEAIRDQIEKGITQIESIIFPEKKTEYDILMKKLLQQKKTLNIFTSDKSAVELVSEGRER